jgi:uncharacterized Zn finger protein
MAWYMETPRLTMSQVRARAERAARKDRAGKRSPVRVEGRTIARSFWGQAWCAHIESFSDYASRLGRGRSYLYAGAVIDLQIGPGIITAEVQGSSLYRQTIEVERLTARQRAGLVRAAAGKIDSLVALLRGQLPPSLLAAMTDPATGVFPTSRQIGLRCSCPDYATLCKHLAAVLYGFGARLDAAPELLFRLRGVDVEELVTMNPTALATREIADDRRATGDLAAIFGIDLVDTLPIVTPPRPVRVAREHLKVLGLPARTIDAWVREGVLTRTAERHIYERTAEADRRISAMLAC